MGFVLVILMYALWSSVFSLGKIALQHSPPIFLTGARMTLAGLILTAYLFLRKRGSFNLNKKQLLSLGLLSIFSIYLTNILEFWGLQYLTAAKTCFIYSLSPLFAAFFSYLHFGEKMTPRKWIGLSIGFLGILPVLLTQNGAEELLSLSSFLSWPTVAIMGAALSSVYGWVLLRLLVKNETISPLMANGSSMLIGGVIAFIHSFFVDNWSSMSLTIDQVTPLLQALLLMTLVSNIICYNLYGMMLKRFTATFLSFAGLLSPIFASMNAWIFLGEKPDPLIFLSTGVVLVGLGIVYSSELKTIVIAKPATQEL